MKLIEETAKINKVKMGIFECECGVQLERSLSNGKKQKHCKACGNKSMAAKNKINRTIHGGKYTKLYGVWNGLKDRCLNPNGKDAASYHNKNVTVCDEWKDSFEAFRDWAMSNGYKEGLSLDKDVGSAKLGLEIPIYSPETCVFTDCKTQARNKTTTVITIDIASGIRSHYDKYGFTKTVEAFKDTCSRSVVSNVVYGGQWND